MASFNCRYGEYFEEHRSLGIGIIASSKGAGIRDAADRALFESTKIGRNIESDRYAWHERMSALIYDRQRTFKEIPAHLRILTQYVDVTLAQRIFHFFACQKEGSITGEESDELERAILEYTQERDLAIRDQIDEWRILSKKRELTPGEQMRVEQLQRKQQLLKLLHDPLLRCTVA